jgi:hypothetical protein
MSSTVDDLTMEYIEDGITTVKELDKHVLTKGAWATVMYKFQNWNRTKQEYSPVGYSIRRYQKRDGAYQQRSKFNISSNDQAQKIIEMLTKWTAEDSSAKD